MKFFLFLPILLFFLTSCDKVEVLPQTCTEVTFSVSSEKCAGGSVFTITLIAPEGGWAEVDWRPSTDDLPTASGPASQGGGGVYVGPAQDTIPSGDDPVAGMGPGATQGGIVLPATNFSGYLEPGVTYNFETPCWEGVEVIEGENTCLSN